MNHLNNHATHSRLLRSWSPKEVESWASQEALDRPQGQTFVLETPHDGHVVRISFTTYPSHPDRMRVHSTNWKCEYEPSGIFEIGVCRKFWKTLVAAGFVQVQF